MRIGAIDHRPSEITEGPIWKPLMSFFFPIWLGTFFQQFYNTADAMIVGNFVGTTALAAVGATSAIINLLVGFFTGLASGASVVISQHFGAGEHAAVSKSVHTSMILAAVGGLGITVVGIALTPFSLRLMNTPQEVMADAIIYMRIYYLGMIPLMLYNMGTSALRAIGDSRRPVYFLIISAISNIVLDLLFVTVIPMGVAGAGSGHSSLRSHCRGTGVAVSDPRQRETLATSARGASCGPDPTPGNLPFGSARRSAVCAVYHQQHGHPGQYQRFWHRHRGRLDCLWQSGLPLLDDRSTPWACPSQPSPGRTLAPGSTTA